MNFDGIFDKYNYPTEAKAWIYNNTKPQFMDYVVRGMRNFLKSPFK